MKSDIVQRLGYAVFIRGIGVRLPVSEKRLFPFLFFTFLAYLALRPVPSDTEYRNNTISS